MAKGKLYHAFSPNYRCKLTIKTPSLSRHIPNARLAPN